MTSPRCDDPECDGFCWECGGVTVYETEPNEWDTLTWDWWNYD